VKGVDREHNAHSRRMSSGSSRPKTVRPCTVQTAANVSDVENLVLSQNNDHRPLTRLNMYCDFLLILTIIVLLLTTTLRHCTTENKCSINVAVKFIFTAFSRTFEMFTKIQSKEHLTDIVANLREKQRKVQGCFFMNHNVHST